MLSPRTETILKIIIENYIHGAAPVPSQNLTHKYGLKVSSATIRNEMAHLKKDGYILQPHTSAGSVPSDKGYRHYVETLDRVRLPVNQQLMISHLFHQVENRLEEWIKLTANILAHLSQNMAVVATAKSNRSLFKHVELVSLQDTTALIVLVLQGARLRQQLLTFNAPVTQATLKDISSKLNTEFAGLSARQIQEKELILSHLEVMIVDIITEIMAGEDQVEFEDLYLDGLQFIFSQPEFTDPQRNRALLTLTEQKDILKVILPHGLKEAGVHTIIGAENAAEPIQNCSVVFSQYGIPGEAVGCLAIVGPTRMAYSRNIASVDYMAEVLTHLISRLYAQEPAHDEPPEN